MTADVGVPAGSRAVLIGVSAYEYTEFPPVRAARNSLQAMRWLLADPELCGWPPERITMIANPISAADLLTDIVELADTASGALLLYYVGHGVLSGRGELCLTVTSTHPDRPETSGLPWNTLADVLRSSPARSRLSILDCCFAGQAIEALAGDGHSLLAGMTYAEGVYTLTATTRNRAAHAPPADQQEGVCTSFTGELRDVIRDGIPDHAPRLTLGEIYPVLRRRLVAKGLPAPSQRGADTGGELAFIVNSAVLPRPPAELTGAGEVGDVPAPVQEQLVRPAQSRYSRIVTDALRTAQAISEENPKARALAAPPGRSPRPILVAPASSPPTPNASPSPSPAGQHEPRRWPPSPVRWPPMTPIVPRPWRSRFPRRASGPRRWPTPRKRSRPSTPSGPPG